jgi:hypothetical protein
VFVFSSADRSNACPEPHDGQNNFAYTDATNPQMRRTLTYSTLKWGFVMIVRTCRHQPRSGACSASVSDTRSSCFEERV